MTGGGGVGGNETGGLWEAPGLVVMCGSPTGGYESRPYGGLVLGLLLLGHHALAGVYDCAGCYHDHCEDDQDDRPGRESSAFLFNRWQRHCRGRLRWRWRRYGCRGWRH